MAGSVSLVITTVIVMVIRLASAEIPPIFVFGDSKTDVGTNNYLPVERARMDFPFNGIDFRESTPTGRFSNGFNIADTIGILFFFFMLYTLIHDFSLFFLLDRVQISYYEVS